MEMIKYMLEHGHGLLILIGGNIEIVQKLKNLLEYITQYSEYITDVSIKKNTWTRATYGNKASWLQLNGVYPSYQDMLSGTKLKMEDFSRKMSGIFKEELSLLEVL